MTYSEPLINQVRIFVLSIGVGVPLCLLYILMQSAVAFFHEKKWAIYTTDILFSAVSAFVSFFFMVFYNNGRVRLHLIIGEAFGFFVFYFAVGKYLLAFGRKIALSLSKVTLFLLYPFLRVAKAFGNIYYLLKDLFKGFSDRFKNLKEKKIKKEGYENKKVENKRKKFKFIGKIHLKNPYKSV